MAMPANLAPVPGLRNDLILPVLKRSRLAAFNMQPRQLRKAHSQLLTGYGDGNYLVTLNACMQGYQGSTCFTRIVVCTFYSVG